MLSPATAPPFLSWPAELRLHYRSAAESTAASPAARPAASNRKEKCRASLHYVRLSLLRDLRLPRSTTADNLRSSSRRPAAQPARYRHRRFRRRISGRHSAAHKAAADRRDREGHTNAPKRIAARAPGYADAAIFRRDAQP